MTEKVKLTLEQAQSIKAYDGDEEGKTSAIKLHIEKAFLANYSLNRLTLDELIRALYIGYEVEPEFKVGDWVAVSENNRVYLIGKISEIETEDSLQFAKVRDSRYEVPQSVRLDHLKHATAEEIKQEKERRFWSRHGRKVWELKEGDLLKSDLNYLTYEVVDIDSCGNVSFINDNGFRHKNYIIKGYRLVCFAENRLDISHD